MLKVTVIGGGSTYTPELVNGFLDRVNTFPLDELWLMDTDWQRLEIVGGFAKRLCQKGNNPFKVILSADQKASIDSASYVITQLRVGQMQARREDEYLGARHSLIGQETTGIGGMAKALRTIPVILDIAHDMLELAPGALLVNFTNPSGLITEALFRYAPGVSAVGVCNSAFTTKMEILKAYNQLTSQSLRPDQVKIDTLGLNHLTWYRGFEVNGVDIWPQVFDALLNRVRTEEDPDFDLNTLQNLGMLPNAYLRYYYYTDKMLKLQQSWPPSRAEAVMKIEQQLLSAYADPSLVEVPDMLMLRGGAYYSTVATQILNAHYNDLDEVHVANVQHNGAVQGWDPGWVLEMPCRVNKKGVHPLPAEPLPTACYDLLAQVKAYELLTVEASIRGDRQAVYRALLTHPLGPAADQINKVLEDMIQTNKAYLPRFFD